MRSGPARLVVLALALSAAPAAAQDRTQDWTWCTSSYGPPELTIAGCTAIIQAGGEAGPRMAAAFYYRGRAWLAKDLHDQALPDFNESLRLKPDDARALDSRGFTYLKMARFAAAIADYDAALRIDPKLAASLFGRGLARRRMGDNAAGDADIAAARAIDGTVADWFARRGLVP